MKSIINVVHLHVLYSDYYTGVDRYLSMYSKGIRSKDEYEIIRMHKVFMIIDNKTIFPRIKLGKEGELSAVIPFPHNNSLLFKGTYWKDKCMTVISDMLMPFFENISHPIIQCHNLFLSNLAIELKNRFGGKILLHLHCLPWKFKLNEDKELFNRLYLLYKNKEFELFKKEENSLVVYDLFDSIICLSEVAKRYLVDVHRIDSNKIVIIHNGLVKHVASNLRKKDSPVSILYVGKVCFDKGIFDLLDALKIVNDKGYKFKFIIAGSCTEDILNKMKSKYDGMNVEYMGQVAYSRLHQLYKSCTFGVIPSLHEQCSYVALEMAMFGLPMIVSEVDALAEMFEHEKTVLFTPLTFDPDLGIEANRDILVNNIVKLMENESLRKQLGKNARKYYEKHGTIDQMIECMVHLYKHLI